MNELLMVIATLCAPTSDGARCYVKIYDCVQKQSDKEWTKHQRDEKRRKKKLADDRAKSGEADIQLSGIIWNYEPRFVDPFQPDTQKILRDCLAGDLK